MANIKSAKKRILTNNKSHELNNEFKASMNTAVKKVEKSILDNNIEEATKNLSIANKKIDKALSKGIIKKNTAARKKSALAKKLNEISGK